MTVDLDLDALAEQLADFAPPEKKTGRGPREERIIAGFEEIQRFVEKHGHAPRQGESRDIFERIYATRLEPRADHADYIGHWLRILKGDRKAIFTAASAANKAAEYLKSIAQIEQREAA